MLELKNLVFLRCRPDDGGTKRIIDNLSLTIPDDRFTVITGPTAAASPRSAKLIMGIEEPTSGQILFNGEDITDKSITERSPLAYGYGFQQPAASRHEGEKLLDYRRRQEAAHARLQRVPLEGGLCSASYLTREVESRCRRRGEAQSRSHTFWPATEAGHLRTSPRPASTVSFDRLTETFRDIHECRDGRSIVIISHQERIISLAAEIVLLARRPGGRDGHAGRAHAAARVRGPQPGRSRVPAFTPP